MIVALDIGGTKIEAALFKGTRIIKKKRVYFKKKSNDPTVKITRAEAIVLICSAIDSLEKKITGIGISIPDIIKDGKIVGKSKISGLSSFGLGGYLRKRYNCYVAVQNDAACFAFGEAMLGAGKGRKNVVGIIWGTGVGSGIVLDGRLYSGTSGSAGEFGHNITDLQGPKDRSGLPGTVEAYAGGPNIVINYQKYGGKNKLDAKAIFHSKEKAAKRAVADALRHISIGLSGLTNILNPDIIVIGGGLSNTKHYSELNRLTKKYAFSHLKSNVRIVKNKLGDSGGIYGAALLAQGR